MINHHLLDLDLLKKVEAILEQPCHQEFAAIKREWELLGGDEMHQRSYDMMCYGFSELVQGDYSLSKKTVILLTVWGLVSDEMGYQYDSFEWFTHLGVVVTTYKSAASFAQKAIIKIIGSACLALHQDIDMYGGMSQSAGFGKYQNPEFLAELIFEYHDQGVMRKLTPAQVINRAIETAYPETKPFKFDFNSIDGMFFYCIILIQFIKYESEGDLNHTPQKELNFKIWKSLNDINWAEEFELLNPTSDPLFLKSFHQFITSEIPQTLAPDQSEWLFDNFWLRFLEESGLLKSLSARL